VGVRVPEGRDNASTFFIDLLLNPWEPVEVPGVAAIQVVKPTGAPDPATMVFSPDHLWVDLYDVGRQTEHYEQVSARRVAEVLHQQPRTRTYTRPSA
jgi:hypothetical protein